MEAIGADRLQNGKDISIAIDATASEFLKTENIFLKKTVWN